jgi:hypothetical protein
MSTVENLWGDIPKKPSILTPLSVLKRQASLLGDLTGGSLSGEVTTMASADGLMHVLVIVASSLNNYRVEVLSVRHGLLLYPTRITNRISGDRAEAPDQTALVSIIREILSSGPVRGVVEALLAQVQAGETPPRNEEDIPF